ncbi:MAG: nucleotidyltransferase family protein [Methanocorpusculum sp.]|nr:nucleotidyltransferase family protein [Methanocorpusculum sp.]
MSDYVSIKDDVLKKLEANLPEIRERFGIETIGIFGSVARGEDNPDSDVDVFYTYAEGREHGMFKTVELIDFLESLFGREVDFVSFKWMRPMLKKYVEPDMITVTAGEVSV